MQDTDGDELTWDGFVPIGGGAGVSVGLRYPSSASGFIVTPSSGTLMDLAMLMNNNEFLCPETNMFTLPDSLARSYVPPGSGTSTSNSNSGDPEECDAHLTRDEAAIEYAKIARSIHATAFEKAAAKGISRRDRRASKFVISYARLYSTIDQKCIGVAAVSNLRGFMNTVKSKGVYWIDPIREAMNEQADRIVTIRHDEPTIDSGHAETNLYGSASSSFYSGFRSMGISHGGGPCTENDENDANCSTYFADKEISIGYITNSGTEMIYYMGNTYQL